MALTEQEYLALRHTIALRGTVRIALLPAILLGWSALLLTVLLHDLPSWAYGVPLLTLAAGFEAIHALHVGAERIGRFLQVQYEADGAGPRWETTAMAVGPALPGGGVDPLFAVVFGSAAAANFAAALIAGREPLVLLLGLGALHALLVARILRARRAAARQRRIELAAMRAVLRPDAVGSSEPPSAPHLDAPGVRPDDARLS